MAPWTAGFIVFVLMEWSLLPNALRPFLDLLCSPDLDNRTWICQLNFLRGLFFQAWGSLTSLKSQTRAPSLKSLPEDLCSGFLRPEKIKTWYFKLILSKLTPIRSPMERHFRPVYGISTNPASCGISVAANLLTLYSSWFCSIIYTIITLFLQKRSDALCIIFHTSRSR